MIDLDVEDLRAGGSRRTRAVESIARAGLHGCAAFTVHGHGIDPALFDASFAVAREFFALPRETKQRYASGPHNIRGFQPLPTGPGDVREKFLATTQLGSRDPEAPVLLPGDNQWPAEVPRLREAVEACQRELTALGKLVLGGISESLGLAPEVLGTSCDAPGGSCFWLLHYPAVAPVEGRPGQGTSPHSDLHPLAIIVQDPVGGLDVLDAGEWKAVDPRERPLVCHMGDLIERWSNGSYKRNVHRVRSPAEGSRYSLALFMQPALDAVIEPVPTCVGPDRPSLHAPTTFGESLFSWFRAVEEGRAGYVPG